MVSTEEVHGHFSDSSSEGFWEANQLVGVTWAGCCPPFRGPSNVAQTFPIRFPPFPHTLRTLVFAHSPKIYIG